MKLSEEQRLELAKSYHTGTSPVQLIKKFQISKSTLYRIVKEYPSIKHTENKHINYKEHLDLLRKLKKSSDILELKSKSNFNSQMTLDEKLDLYEEYKSEYSVNVLLEAFNISKGTYHNRILNNRVPTFLDEKKSFLAPKIYEIFNSNEQKLGSTKIQAILKEQNIHTSKKYIIKLMKEMGLYAVSTNSKKIYNLLHKKENILKRKFNPQNINEVWVSDVTYFKVKDYFLYTCVIMDLFSRKIIAFNVSKNQSTKLITSTFKNAYENRKPRKNLIFHSDRGGIYVSASFQLLLKKLNINQSFSKAGTPHDNAVIESFFKTLKAEELYRREYTSEKHFKTSIANYMNYYNEKRPHKHNNYKSPNEKELLALNSSK